MLPSGNDAAMTLAENFSELLLKSKTSRDKPMKLIFDKETSTRLVVNQ
jgi:hypothetical protein